MKVSKIAEWVGFAMIIIAFILWLAADLGYIFLPGKSIEIMGLIGTIFWSLGYMQNEKKVES